MKHLLTAGNYRYAEFLCLDICILLIFFLTIEHIVHAKVYRAALGPKDQMLNDLDYLVVF